MKSNLQKFRKEAGLTLQEVSEACGISKSHLHDLEKQTGSCPSLMTAYAISGALGKSVYEVWPDNTEIIEELVVVRKVKRK